MRVRSSGYTILTEEQIQIIHEKSMEVLERIGVWVMGEQGLDILRSAGCDVRDPKRVKIPRELVMEALKKTPKKIDVYDRNGNLAMELEPGSVYFGTGGDCPVTIDLETGKRRPSTKEDIAKLARFCDALPNIDFVMSFGVALDKPPDSRHVHQYEAMLLNTTKPCVVSGHGPADARAQIEMAAAAVGGLDELRKRPHLLFLHAAFAPLTHSKWDMDKCLVCAEYGAPFAYSEGGMLGSSAPVTMAGALVQSNANVLAGNTVFQLKYPGAKFIYAHVNPVFEMRYGLFSYGSPEINISVAAMGDLARFYNLPSWGFAGITDAKVVDAQAGLEYAFSTYLPARSGVSLLHDCGYLDVGTTSSFESVLLADEINSMVKYYLKPIEVNEKTMALDVINEVGPGGSYLMHPHTVTNFRQHLWFPRFVFHGRYSDWVQEGSKNILTRLNERAREIFAGHKVPELPKSARKEIAAIVERHVGELVL